MYTPGHYNTSGNIAETQTVNGYRKTDGPANRAGEAGVDQTDVDEVSTVSCDVSCMKPVISGSCSSALSRRKCRKLKPESLPSRRVPENYSSMVMRFVTEAAVVDRG